MFKAVIKCFNYSTGCKRCAYVLFGGKIAVAILLL